MTGLLALLMAALTLGVYTPGTGHAPMIKQLAFGPDTCIQGYVWREATPGDHVCVTPTVRDQTRADNAQAAARKDPAGGIWDCRTGFVWRETDPNDHVCVPPATRAQAKQDNREVTRRWAAVSHPFGQFIRHPFENPALKLGIVSTRTPRHLVVGVENARTDNSAGFVIWTAGGIGQQFYFRPLGGAPVRSNAFEIVEARTGKCLDVAQASPVNSTRVVLWGCHGGPNQRWYFHRVWNMFEQWDEFQLRAYHSNKCLDVHSPGGGAAAQGAHLQQWDCLNGYNQRWRAREGG